MGRKTAGQNFFGAEAGRVKIIGGDEVYQTGQRRPEEGFRPNDGPDGPEAGLGLSSGADFGREGLGFARMNVATNRATLEKAMTQLPIPFSLSFTRTERSAPS